MVTKSTFVQSFQAHLQVLSTRTTTKRCTILMDHTLVSMKSSLTSNRGLTGICKQLANVWLEVADHSLLLLEGMETQMLLLVLQMLAVMEAETLTRLQVPVRKNTIYT